jgi:hypothetical protein
MSTAEAVMLVGGKLTGNEHEYVIFVAGVR